MAGPKKNGIYLNIYVEIPLYERLKALCEDASQTKMAAVRRALLLHCDDYAHKRKKTSYDVWVIPSRRNAMEKAHNKLY